MRNVLSVGLTFLWFNTPDPKFENIEVVSNSPEWIHEIVTSRTLMCDAGQHRELALRYLENAVNVLATDAPVPTDQEVESLLNVKDDYDFFVIEKSTIRSHKFKTMST